MKDKKIPSIIALVGAAVICVVLLMLSGIYLDRGELVLQKNSQTPMFIFVILIFWLVVILFYKTFKIEKVLKENTGLILANAELLQLIIKSQISDFDQLATLSENNRGLLLKLYFDQKDKEDQKLDK